MSNLGKTFRYVNSVGQELVFDMAHGFAINKPKGVDVVSVTHNEAQGFNQIGTSIVSSVIEHRPVTISGVITGRPGADYKEQLLRTVRPDLPGKLYADDYYLEVRPTETPVISAHRNLAEFSFQLLAGYPYWQAEERKSVELYVPSTGWSEVINNSDVPVPFEVVFSVVTNPVTSVYIEEQETGKRLTVQYSGTDGIATGEVISVSITHNSITAVSNVKGDVSGLIKVSSDLLRIEPGIHHYAKWFSGTQPTTVNTVLTFSEEKMGVCV